MFLQIWEYKEVSVTDFQFVSCIQFVSQRLKKENEEMIKQYGYCIIDNHKEKIGNFKIEPPGLFRGRGDHPKQGMMKKRVNPEDVIINCSKWVLRWEY